ncbi:MAG: hypothetical protein JWR10_903 [Rubritepida sp.]|nr:hypothetical protein [Rubritepida sp.]
MSEATTLTVRVPLAIARRPGRATVIIPVQQAGQEHVQMTRSDPALVKALARAFRYQKLLDGGRYASITEMAAAEKIERGYLGSLLRLTLLAPNTVEAILFGDACGGLALPALLEPFPVNWFCQNGRGPGA